MRASPAAPRVHLVMVPNPPYHPRGDFALLPPERAESPEATPPRSPNVGRIVALPSAPLSGVSRSDSSRSAASASGTTEADSPGPRRASGVVEPGAGAGSPPPMGHRVGPGSPPPLTHRAGPPGLPPVGDHAAPALTFGNIGVYDSALFAELPRLTKLKLLPLFRQWIAAGLVSGERFDGPWANVGTPDDLARLDAAQADPA